MRPSWLLSIVSLLLVTNNGPTVVAERHAVARRQAESSTAPPSAAAITPAPSSASQAIPQSSNGPSSGSAPTASSSRGGASTSLASTEKLSSVSGTASANGTSASSGSIVFGATATPIANTTINGTIITGPQILGLPIQPSITPAMAVAGAIMILSGAFYTLIGIKTQRLHIFFSSTYLVALAVTVLIEYVMHPPVSNGVQGAYFTAACVTGFIFGAISVVFADVTEGLGCFLGGFCLAMWFLVLKQDGLIQNTAGKAIFIGCFTVGAFGLYVSHITRIYGLIGSTSFAGATVIVLGIDCFSRAGLKEFWLYIWSLNDALFPLNYMGPYPITRGIRVEIAAIILLFLLGVMSQMKVWKIVKQRREEKAAQQLRKDEERDRDEEALGRRIEAGNEQERSMWDAVYGDKSKKKGSNVDSGIGTEAPSTTGKDSISVADARELHDEGMEMQNLQGSQRGGGRITVHVAQEDDISEAPRTIAGNSGDSVARRSREPSIEESHTGGAKSVVSDAASATSKAVDPSLTLKPKSKGPKFVPLPFTVPGFGEAASEKADVASSVATFAASEHPQEQAKRSSKRLSGSGLMRKLSGRSQKDAPISSISQEALVIPHLEDDRSSLAATMDGISDHIDSDEESPSPTSGRPALENVPSTDLMVTAPQTPMLSVASQKPLDLGTGVRSDEYFPAGAPSGPESTTHTTVAAADAKSVGTLEAPQQLARQASLLAGNLPEGGASRIVSQYRTNEWAKYLDDADAPSVDDLKIQKTRAADAGEKVAPVNVRALQETPLTAEPKPIVTKNLGDKAHLPSNRAKSNSASSPTNPYRAQPRDSRANSSGSAVIASMDRTASQSSLASSNASREDLSRPNLPKSRTSQTSLIPPRAFRTSSSPLVGTPLTESPIEEGVEASFPVSRFTPSPSHLMSQRDTIIRNKPSSTSLLRNGSSSSINRTSSTPNTSSPMLASLDEDDDDDNISLSQRKSMLQQQSSLSRSSSGTTTPYTTSRLSLNPNNPYLQPSHFSTSSNLLNSNPPHSARPHLPAETSSTAAISSWRASLAQLPTSEVQQQQELELRRQQLIAEKQAQRHSKLSQEKSREQRESVIGREMRRGSMMDAHREAMRRMQAGVNESLRPAGT